MDTSRTVAVESVQVVGTKCQTPLNVNAEMCQPRKPRLLGVFAHPDDETVCAGGMLAQHVDQGGEAMVVSFTKGQRGQIRDPASATRQTLGAVREQEFYLACERLGVQHALCLDYMDGSLSQLDPQILLADAVRLMRAFRPDIVLTFDREGGYGHPDHIAISDSVTQAVEQSGSTERFPEQLASGLAPHAPSYLYHSVFVRQDRLLGTELAAWLGGPGRGTSASAAWVDALPFFASDLTTLGHTRDDVRTQWYPQGTSIIEPGEDGDSLFLILSGQVDLLAAMRDGHMRTLTRKGPGDFLGVTALLDHRPSRTHAVAASGVTCLVLARERSSLHAPRGPGMPIRESAMAGVRQDDGDSRATTAIDVSPYIQRKLAAMRAHRTQYARAPDLVPASILERLLGMEYFQRVFPTRAWETALPLAYVTDMEQAQAA